MNKMREVANLLGVKLEERFKIKHHPYEYYLCEKGLMCVANSGNVYRCLETLSRLLLGEYSICKKSWKAKNGERYYVPYIGEDANVTVVEAGLNEASDKIRYETGFMCRTPEQAIELRDKIVDFVKKEQEYGY